MAVRRSLRLAAPVSRRIRARRGVIRPAVTVIVPFFNVSEYLAECIESILGQSATALELVLVDDGSTDGSQDIARRYAAKDKRVKLVSQPNAGPGAARNNGVKHARGRFLAFVDSDDRLPRDALRTLLDAATANGADITAGAIRRFNSTRLWNPLWGRAVHSTNRFGVRLQDIPGLLRNNYPVGKLYRRDFWLAQQLAFREGAIYEDQPLIALMLLRARLINVLTDEVYDYRAREDRSSISQRPEEINDLRDRVLAWKLSLEALREEAPAEVLRGWYETVYNTHLHWYLGSDSIADRTYWEILRESLRSLTAHEPAGMRQSLRPEKRVPLELLGADEQATLVDFRESGGYEPERFPAVVTRSGIRHQLPVAGDVIERLPEDVLTLRPAQLELHQELVKGGWSTEDGEPSLHLLGFAYIAYLDSSEYPPEIELVVTNRATGQSIYPEVRHPVDLGFPAVPTRDGARHDACTYSARIPLRDLLASGDADWEISVRVTAAGVTVAAPLRNLSPSSGLAEASGWLARDGRRVRLVSRPNWHVPLQLSVDQPPVVVTSLEPAGRELMIKFRARAFPLLLAAQAPGRRILITRPRRSGNGTWEATLRFPDSGGESAPAAGGISWYVRVIDASGRKLPLALAGEGEKSSPVLSADSSVFCDLVVRQFPRGRILATGFRSTGDGVIVSGRLLAPAQAADCSFRIGDGSGYRALGTESTDGEVTTRFSNESGSDADQKGMPVTAESTASDGSRSPLPVVADRRLLLTLPHGLPSAAIAVERGKDRSVVLRKI